MLKKYFSYLYHIKIKLSIIIPNGIDEYWLKNINSSKNIKNTKERIKNKNINLLYVGLILRRKNIELILKTVYALKNKGWNVNFDVVGRIVDKKYFRTLCKDKSFNYLGEMNKEELLKCYRKHDIFVMTSKAETFGLVYAEAMSQGLPIIYTKNQGFDNQFQNGTVGFSISIDDEKDCLNAIINICSNYEKLYNNCIEKVKKYNWTNLCKEYIEIYNDIVSKGE